jgi:hypothetical protein
MANRRIVYNGLRVTLGAPLTNVATAVTFSSPLTHSGGVNVPTLGGGGDYIPLALIDPASGALVEVVRLTAYTAGNTNGTISRGQEGTAGVAHAAGVIVVQAPLVDDVADLAWTAFPYAANWADIAGGWQTGRYRKVRWNRVRVEFFALRSTSASGADAIIGTLPAGFRPLAFQGIGQLWLNAGAYAPNTVYVNSSGQVKTSVSSTVGNSVPVFTEFTLD